LPRAVLRLSHALAHPNSPLRLLDILKNPGHLSARLLRPNQRPITPLPHVRCHAKTPGVGKANRATKTLTSIIPRPPVNPARFVPLHNLSGVKQLRPNLPTVDEIPGIPG